MDKEIVARRQVAGIEHSGSEILAAGRGDCGGCYALRLDESASASLRAAWRQVDGKRESLHLREADGTEVEVDRGIYVADHCFVGGQLLWSRMDEPGRWSLRGRGMEIPLEGRVGSLASWDDLLAWEEREGKRTRVRLLQLADGRPGAAVDVTDGSFNAYDPAVARLADGGIVVIFGGFRHGNYRIFAQRLSEDFKLLGGPVMLSDQAAPCVHPSVWPARNGGFWFSYTAFDVPVDRRGDLVSLLKHPRHLLQRQAFQWRGRAYVGCWSDGELWSPVGSRGNQGIQAGMVVYPSVGAAHTRVFETDAGRLALLLRQHAPPRFSEDNAPANRPGVFSGNPAHLHPILALCLLGDREWQPAQPLSGHLNADGPLSMRLHACTLQAAYDESLRGTGWGKDAEWFHADAVVQVGVLKVGLPGTPPHPIELRPFSIAPYHGNDLGNPDVERRDREGRLHALGQTHTHSHLSVCCREIDRDGHFNYRFLQDVMCCDFGGITDHDYNTTDLERLLIRKLAEFYYFPGQFVAIPAYEWTGSCIAERGGPWGHVNPLWLEEEGDLEFYTPVDASCEGSTLEQLARVYAGHQVVAPPHHSADSIHPFKWADFDPMLSPVVEIFQDCRGAGECCRAPGTTNFLHTEQGHWVVDWLKKGLRFGFIGGGDHTGIALAGVLVHDLTRTDLYEAFQSRRTFATSGVPARVEFSANGTAMGGAVVSDPVQFQLSVEAAEPIAEVQILREGELVEVRKVGGKRIEHHWTVPRQRPGEFWYVRILLKNGELLWTSPIWLDSNPPHETLPIDS